MSSCYYKSSSCSGSMGVCSKCSANLCNYHFNDHVARGHDVACSICGNRSQRPYNRCGYHMNAKMFPGVKVIKQ